MIITIPNIIIKHNTFYYILALIISIILIIPIIGFKNYLSIILIITLSILIYIILININNQNIYDSLPSTVIPQPPHLGLDGISLDNLIAGTPKINYY